MSEKGIKFDGEKPDYSLIPPFALDHLAQLLTKGAKKYAPNNWQKVKPKKRYFAAAGRHLTQYMMAVLRGVKADQYDEETGIHHLICVACNVMFLYEHETVYSVDEPFYGNKEEEAKEISQEKSQIVPDKNIVDKLAEELENFKKRQGGPISQPFQPFQPQTVPLTPGPNWWRNYPYYYDNPNSVPGVWCGTPLNHLTVDTASDIIKSDLNITSELKTKQ